MTEAFNQGMGAREVGLSYMNNPYSSWMPEYQEWINGWKLENWRIEADARKKGQIASRKEVSRQIQINRDFGSASESC